MKIESLELNSARILAPLCKGKNSERRLRLPLGEGGTVHTVALVGILGSPVQGEPRIALSRRRAPYLSKCARTAGTP